MDKSLSPRDAAARLGITVDTLRRWEREELIESERTPGGQRRYREADIAAVLGKQRISASRSNELPRHGRDEPDNLNEPLPTVRSHIDVPAWERRIREEEAELQVARLRHERAALLRAEEADQQRTQERKAAATRKEQEARLEAERQSKAVAAERERLETLRQYGRGLAMLAPPEYQTRVARDLTHSVNTRDYPDAIGSHLLYSQVRTRVDEVLKPWRDAHARERARLAEETKRTELVGGALRYLALRTASWDDRDSHRVRRQVEDALEDEFEPDWTYNDARCLVDDVLDEWDSDD